MTDRFKSIECVNLKSVLKRTFTHLYGILEN